MWRTVSGDSKTSQVVRDQPRPHPLLGWGLVGGAGARGWALGRLLAPCPPCPRHQITAFRAAELEPRATVPLSHPDAVAAPWHSDLRPAPCGPRAPPSPGAHAWAQQNSASLAVPHCPLNPPPKERTQSTPSWAPKLRVLVSFLPSFLHSFPHSDRSILGQEQSWPWGTAGM